MGIIMIIITGDYLWVLLSSHICNYHEKNGTLKRSIDWRSRYWGRKFQWIFFKTVFWPCIRSRAYSFSSLFIPGVHFTNIKHSRFFVRMSFRQLFSSFMYVEKQHSYVKFARLTLMKLTVGVNFINILCSR